MSKPFSDSAIDSINEAKNSLRVSIQGLLTKVRVMLTKISKLDEENKDLRDQVKELSQKITDLKLQVTHANSQTISKDKEISDLKNVLLTEKNTKSTVQDKEIVRSRIKELISRIDVHLDQYDQEN